MGNKKVLAIDIGGTHTRFALFNVDKEPLKYSFLKVYPSQPYQTFEELWEVASRENEELRVEILACVMGVAGIVKNNYSKLTNLPWVLNGKNLIHSMKIPQVHLLNDLQSAAYGILGLPKEEMVTLREGEENEGAISLMGAGTGLGEAFVVQTDKGYRAYPSEGGHADFAPINPDQFALCEYLGNKLGRVSYENVCSGPGLWNIYSFIRERKGVKNTLQEGGEFVTHGALEDKDPICVEALNMFLEIYAQEAGNMAVRQLSFGGVYIGGGIAPRMIDYIKDSNFSEVFIKKGVREPFMKKIPLKVIVNDYCPLFGSAWFGKQYI